MKTVRHSRGACGCVLFHFPSPLCCLFCLYFIYSAFLSLILSWQTTPTFVQDGWGEEGSDAMQKLMTLFTFHFTFFFLPCHDKSLQFFSLCFSSFASSRTQFYSDRVELMNKKSLKLLTDSEISILYALVVVVCLFTYVLGYKRKALCCCGEGGWRRWSRDTREEKVYENRFIKIAGCVFAV